MPRLAASLLVLTLGSAAALALVACGEEDAQLLPGETAREITANLDAVQQLADEGDCAGAESAAQQVGEQVEVLTGVDRQLKQALEEGADRLSEVIAGCEEETTEAIAPATIPPETEEEEEEPQKDEKEKKEKPKEEAPEKEAEPTPPPQPPQAEGEAKGRPPTETEPPVESEEGGEETPSGGVSPSAPAGGDG
jgi:outer membrane biosynthesis protein TonB